jgi:2-polyprenyl-3-methyl-5-hydroxy-6-metoxy-1,4-benzoquinol methylase
MSVNSTKSTALRRVSGSVVHSPIFARGKKLWDENSKDFRRPMTRWEKLICGVYIILEDYSIGEFPRQYEDREKTHQAEIAYHTTRPGVDEEKAFEANMRKPFCGGGIGPEFFKKFADVAEFIQSAGIKPGSRLLELGCGAGWTAEFLALMKYDVTATSISPFDIEQAQRRVASIHARGLACELRYLAASMEDVDQHVKEHAPFDGVFVFEALHHAYDWGQTIRAAHKCLCSGGRLFILSEPNIAHIFISHRVAKITNTHEVGFSRRALCRTLRETGFDEIQVLKNRFHWGVKFHWIMARKRS